MNIIEKINVYTVKMVTQAGDLLPEIKRRIALGWAAFGKVADIMKSRKAIVGLYENKEEGIHIEYMLVIVYGSETCTLKKAHVELYLSIAQSKMESIMWVRHQVCMNDIIKITDEL